MASGGHVRDLPQKELGVNIARAFEPNYQQLPGKKRIIEQLAEAAAKAREVLLATDPDREGEAIAWHISHIIGARARSQVRRVQFHEITKKAVEAALASPGRIDMNKVDAQQARRIMDRLVGYQVSPLLWRTVTGGLSAGRVQSVALRLLCEREAAIEAFVAVEFWTIDGRFTGEKVEPFVARLSKFDGKKVSLGDASAAKGAVAKLEKLGYHVADIKRSRKKRSPPPPYITSTLQQDASRRLGFPVKRTMAIAQKLYEGIELGPRGMVGLITYMRTDSTRLSPEAVEALRGWIASEYGPDLVAQHIRAYKNKKGPVQDAHEAIRPTDVRLTPNLVKPHLAPEEFRLYDMIWRRFVATQMKEVEFDVTTVTIAGGPDVEFRATGYVMMVQGYLILYTPAKGKSSDETSEEELSANAEPSPVNIPANLVVGMPLALLGLTPEQHFTQPPPRYGEASLVKELDEQGIGRPSTYATIISTLLDRQYAEKKEKLLLPTDLGRTVNRILVDRFPDIFSVEFTAKMEEELDKIEEGAKWREVLGDFYEPFKEALDAAEGMTRELKRDIAQPVGRTCPQCGRDLIYRFGKRGRFISCSGFPQCKFAESEKLDSHFRGNDEEVEEKCPNCGRPMLKRVGRYGPFLGCSGYPACKTIIPLKTSHPCPKEGCSGTLSERRTKTRKIFFGCSRYPDCDFLSWDTPVEGPCPTCAAPTLFQKGGRSGQTKSCRRCDWSEPTR